MEYLQYLIQELEKEQADLRRLIDEAVKDGEYLIAHFHSEAMSYVGKKLQTLRNLDDKESDKKRFLASMIARSKTQLTADYPDKIKNYIKAEIEKLEKELADLNQREKVSVPESEILTKYLYLLVSRKIKNVKIVLNKKSNFLLKVSRRRSGIILEIPNLKALKKDLIIHDENIQHFFGLGFTTDSIGARLKLVLTKGDNEHILRELRTVISKIVFEIFYFREFEGDTFVEIEE